MMEKAIPVEVFIPAKRANFERCPHVGDLAGAVESSYGASERADFKFPENKINIDKFPKRFTGQTNHKHSLNLTNCQDILKYHIR
ncbi:MAG: hypothetical protein OXE44_06230 [Nitrospinae bacterium]|nr:hypothetical protein [Nitrospinota bacterium]